ncbi:MAG: response regulator [Kiritimatiellae bacterium]|nr:response regulator [Kiritimatiellia bacterium]
MVTQAAPPKVLVIDDEDLFREMLRVVLGAEYQVLAANSAEEGLRLFQKESPDAVLLDLVMPGRDGIQGLKAIRSIDPIVSVIIVTGFGKLETAKQAMSLGASYYVEKPIDPDDLRKTVRTCVQRTQVEKRRAASVEEMTGMIRQMSADLQRKSMLAAEAEAAVELMYDLGRPLGDATTFLEVLSRLLSAEHATGPDDLKQMANSLSIIEHNMRRCRELAQMCQDLGYDAGGPTEVFSISELVREVIDEMAAWAAAAGLKLDFRLYANGSTVSGNKRQLRRAVKNIVANAIQSSLGHAPTVRIACVPDKTHVELRVEDHGQGYDMGDIALDFAKRFGRGDIVKGAGLGFCLTHRVIERHGGCLHVRSAPGRGTVVFLRLPLATG